MLELDNGAGATRFLTATKKYCWSAAGSSVRRARFIGSTDGSSRARRASAPSGRRQRRAPAALVTQGQVAELIAARPGERRALLEEAAGIVGLHARRHEAELRLRSAEANLRRVDDVLSTLEVQRQQLKKQVRQASRYRNVSSEIRSRWSDDPMAEVARCRASCRHGAGSASRGGARGDLGHERRR